VAALAHKAARSGSELYLATGGNPFFVTEALASDAPGTPTSVSDAVLARVAHRSPEAQRLLEVVSVAPNQIEQGVVAALSTAYGLAQEECLAAGILHLDGQTIAFRHELARLAVEGALSPARRQSLHAALLQALLERGVEQTSLARLAHHAIAAKDATLVLRFAPEAARQASSHGAHREAAAQYQTALHYADSLDAEKRANLLEALAYELYLTGRHRDSMRSCEEALAIRRALDHTEQIGYNLRRLSRLCWFLNDLPQAERCGVAAVELLETLPPGHELALAYANMSHVRMLEGDIADTELWSGRAIELAERIDDAEALSYALNSLGAVLLDGNDERGGSHLERSLAIALEHGLEDHVARAYVNLSVNKLGRRNYAQAENHIREGMAYSAEHDLGSWEHTLRGHRSLLRLAQGDWVGAEEDATAIVSVPWGAATNRIPCLLVLGQIRARRGDPGAEAALDEARDLALAAGVLRAGVLNNFVAIAAARAESRWLQGDHGRCIAEASAGFQQALKHTYPWYVGEVAIWLWRCGELREAPANTFGPYAQQIAGDWRAAATAWEEIGSPYEQALALMDGAEAAQRTALAIFERLGAAPVAEMVRRQLRAAGVRGLPRGPRPATQTNPLGLTPRQLEILLLLAEGLHNPQIADRLSTTPKTVEHHVSAVLAKLDVRSRAEAVRVAHRSGLIP
ncbi:MAG TPA: LuxR C-terminal-related transcriptional regulator, partial [Ktedonobacterales bacterium]|nr:LuxR C-terminal-related transcriptional regulator [Ktedonobacterales bacterium]